jgi:hypothetical protein
VDEVYIFKMAWAFIPPTPRPVIFDSVCKEERLSASLAEDCVAHLFGSAGCLTCKPFCRTGQELRQFSYLQSCGKACAVNLESTCFTSTSGSNELFRYVGEELTEEKARLVPIMMTALLKNC